MKEKNDKDLVFISLEKATTPFDGAIAMTNRFWSICPERGLIFWKPKGRKGSGSPQCNSDERMSKHLNEKLYPWAETKFVPVVYIEHNCYDYI